MAQHRPILRHASRRWVGWNRHRGVALVLVLVAVIVAATVAHSFVSAQSTSISIARNVQKHATARHVAESGLELAVAHIRSNDNWRTEQADGTWVTDEPFGDGTFTIVGEDGEDTDGDGVVDGDGDLSDDDSDLLTLTVTGKINGSSHVARAVVRPIPGDGRKVLMLVPDPGDLAPEEQQRKGLIESWGWEVALIEDGASQAEMEAAMAEADVAYLPNNVNISAGEGELNWPIGVVNEAGPLCPALGISSSHGDFNATTIDLVDNTHEITEPFDPGVLTIAASAGVIEHPAGTLADGATTLAREAGGSAAALVVIDQGGALHGASAPGLNAAYYTLGFAPSWLGEIDFYGEPTATAVVEDIDQPSTSGAGWPGGPANNFAVKLTGSVSVPQDGTWTFYTRSDDGSALWIDDTQVVDNDGLHGMRTRSGSIDLTAGSHSIEVHAFERGGGYGLIAYWQGPGVPGRTVIPADAFNIGAAAAPRVHFPLGGFSVSQLTSDGKGLFKRAMQWAAGTADAQGLAASYFELGSSPRRLSDVDWSADPTATALVPNIYVNAGSGPGWPGGPTDNFGARFVGQVIIPQAGTWRFYTQSDDGSALWIDDTQVVNNDGLHSMRTRNGSIGLSAGPHDIDVKVFERSGQYGLIVSWRGPGVPSQTVIPAGAFTGGPGGGAGYTYQIDWR